MRSRTPCGGGTGRRRGGGGSEQAPGATREARVRPGVLGAAGRRHVAAGVLEEGRAEGAGITVEARARAPARHDNCGHGAGPQDLPGGTPEEGGPPKEESLLTSLSLEPRNTYCEVVHPVRDFGDRGFDSVSKIDDHSSGE